MAPRALIVFVVLGLGGCQTLDKADVYSQARQLEAVASISPASMLPEKLDASCTAKVGKVVPGSEPRVATVQRWAVVADIRDRQADDCADWWATYRAGLQTSAGAQ